MQKSFTLLLFLIIQLISTNSQAKFKVLDAKPVKTQKVSEKVTIDGKLNESIWSGNFITNFIQKDPNEGEPASQKSHVWIRYDDDNVYIAAKLFDKKPIQIDNSLARRDDFFDSDWFFFDVDPYNDDRTGYFFAVNPGGTILDGTYFNDGWSNSSWDGIWEVETNIHDEGWNVEMKIPFSQLRFNENEEMIWGVNFERRIKRNQERAYYVMVPKDESGFISHFADLKGLKGVKSKQRFEILPYIVQKAQYLKHDADNPFYKGNQYKTAIGADFKIGIGSNLNIDATINPDFGQVEVDPAVVNLSAFETFYSEKRPFFIEGENIFDFGFGGVNNNWGFNFGVPNLFYSRRIGRRPQGSTNHEGFTDRPNETRILGAAKLTGKIRSDLSIGAISAFTERTHAVTDSSGKRFEDEIEPFTHYGVIRSRKEFDEGRHALGVIFTSVNRDLTDNNLSDIMSKEAYTFGMDGWTTLDEDETYVINGSVIGSHVRGSKEFMTSLQKEPYRYMQRPDATYAVLDSNRTSMSGLYSRVMLNKQKGNFYINTAVGFISPTFEYNDLGSQWFADRINSHFVMGYRWFEPDNTFRSKSIYLSYVRNYDFEGNVLRNGFWSMGRVQFLNYYSLRYSSGVNFEQYNRYLTRGGPLAKEPTSYYINFDFETDSREKLVAEFDASFSRDTEGSYSYGYEVSLDWRPSPQFYFSIGPEFNRRSNISQWVGSFEDDLAVNTFGKRYVFGRIDQKTISSNIRLNWTFSPKLSLQLFLQPLFSVGSYDKFKELTRRSSYDFATYENVGGDINYDEKNDEYSIDPDGAGKAKSFRFDNPDFNFKSFRGNLVLRWEVLPGSVFYFAWTHDQTNFENPGRLRFGRDMKDLFGAETDDIFLIKFSYWFNT